MNTITHSQFLEENNEPNLKEISNMFQRCGPTVAGGLAWLDNVRFNRWPNQWTDGKKHDVPNTPNGAAFPFDGASDVKPGLVDDIIIERAAMLQVAFWSAQVQPGSVGTDDDAGSYAVALWESLMFSPNMFASLIREVELSAQYQEHYGWFVLAPRWKRVMSLKRQVITMEDIQGMAQQAQGQQGQNTQAPNDPNTQVGMGATSPQPSPPSDGGEGVETAPLLPYTFADLPGLIVDPLQEDAAVEFMLGWYDDFVEEKLPEDMRDQVPGLTDKQVRKVVRDLRTKGKGVVPLPYLAKDEPEIVALKPWDEVFMPPELTTDNEIMFQVERLHEPDLRGRILTEGYDPAWVELAIKQKGVVSSAPMEVRSTPLGIGGLIGPTSTSPVFSAQPTINNTMIEIVHAIYHGVDEDGIPAVWCTTFHRAINDDYAKHEVVEDCEGELPYTAGVREYWCRSITASRGVPERAHTQQNVVKAVLDSIIDRASIGTMPPLNVYESPTGTRYKFGPATQNYVRQGREPKFMEMPNGEGMNEAVEVLSTIKTMIDNSYALMSGDVNPARMQNSQMTTTQKFLAAWNKAKQQVLNLCRRHMDDQDFAAITGAPAGWLDAHRDDTSCLSCQFHFDVRELDPELNLKRIESMNQIALPNDVLGVINRGQWAAYMVRAILGPRAAKMMVQSQPDASAALKDKAQLTNLKVFAGSTPTPLDKMDPTAASLLQLTVQDVASNPVYLKSLNDEALMTLAKLAQVSPDGLLQVVKQAGYQRTPDDRFSASWLNWLKNLQFVGVTQVENRQTGRTGVKPNGGM